MSKSSPTEQSTLTLRSRLLETVARWSAPIRIVCGIAAIAIGIALFIVSATVQTISQITGGGLVFLGLATFMAPRASESSGQDGRGSNAGAVVDAPWLRWIVGTVLIVAGGVIALWPDAGAPWLAFVVGAALLVHGSFTALRGIRGDSDQRITAVLSGLATIAFGVVAFTWPVLTLVIFRLGIGAWFFFIGLQTLIAVFAQRSRQKSSRPPRRSMRWVRTVGASLSLVIAIAFAYGSAQVLGGTPLPVPSSFYAAPDQVPDEPGQLIRSEVLTDGVPAGAQAWKILYTTTHPDGSPAISSGTVIAPKDLGDEPLPLLTVAHGTTGVVRGCAPSLSATPFNDGAGTALAEMVTKHGWVGVTSDYIGLGTSGTHPYLVGDAEARNVLDASLAVQQFDQLTTTTDTVVWGHSQGGQGALWVGEVAEQYAPDLTVLGVAAFAPAADLFGLAEADKNDAAGKTVSAYIAATWNDLYPELKVEQQLTPGSARGVEHIKDLCFNGSDVLAAILRGTQIANQVFPDSVLEGAFGAKLKEQTPEGPFPSPVMVAQGLADPLVKPALQHDWVSSRCKAGEAIDYRTFPGLNHNTLVAADSPLTPEIVQWTLDRWDGQPATPNCDDLPK